MQQQWLPTIFAFKLFQTSIFGDILNQCSETIRVRAITQALNEVMPNHPVLDLTGYDGYDLESIDRANEDLMKAAYGASHFALL